MTFPCDSCGLCCRHLDRNEITKKISREDGMCMFLAEDMTRCTIYDDRPAYCRIDESYIFFEKEMSLTDYYKANAAICNNLRIEHNFTHRPYITIREHN